MINIQNIFRRLKIDKNEYTDLHLVRYYSSFAAISAGKVIGLTKPRMSYCPLANYLNKGVFSSDKYNAEKIMNAVKASIEKKIAEFGFFTGKRQIIRKDIAVPFGASEILMSCLKKEIIDVAVVVCDGAGTVIADKPEIVQGIGARMNGLFYTTPIKEVMKKLEKKGCSFISCGGKIDQIKGIKKAVSLGYKNIAVTINGCM
jgi:putative methanogenesis marker protein 8